MGPYRCTRQGWYFQEPFATLRNAGVCVFVPGVSSVALCADVVEAMTPDQKPKDPPGGTTGRVKLYGRWGGWALAPYTALSGRDNRSHLHWSRNAAGRSKPNAIFFDVIGAATAMRM